MSFDAVAPWYRWLERLRFGGLLQEARVALVEAWEGDPPNKVLVLGDGDGRFVAEAKKQWPKAQFTLVDASVRMMSFAKRRLAQHENVNFVVTPVEDYLDGARNRQFDLMVSHFFLDCFHEDTLRQLVPRLANMLSEKGQWLVTDFQPGSTGW